MDGEPSTLDARESASRTSATETARQDTPRRDAPRAHAVRLTFDVHEMADEMVLTADVPGVAPSAADLRVEHRRLEISCPRETSAGRVVVYRATVGLPDTIDTSSVDAELRGGVLTVRMAKLAQARPRRIGVRAG